MCRIICVAPAEPHVRRMEVDAEVLGSGSFVHLRLRTSGFHALVVADVSSTGMGLVVSIVRILPLPRRYHD